MTSKSPRLMRFIKWGAGIVVVGLWIVIGLVAWAIGVRWPTIHRVDQPGIPDFLYIKADDFLDDSGYVVDLGFETCCTDRLVCKLSGAGRLFESKIHTITPDDRITSIPLRWDELSLCPYKLTSVTLRLAAANQNPGTMAIFDANEPWNQFPLTLNPDCFAANPAAKIASNCPDRPMFKFSLEMDTLQISRGGAK